MKTDVDVKQSEDGLVIGSIYRNWSVLELIDEEPIKTINHFGNGFKLYTVPIASMKPDDLCKHGKTVVTELKHDHLTDFIRFKFSRDTIIKAVSTCSTPYTYDLFGLKIAQLVHDVLISFIGEPLDNSTIRKMFGKLKENASSYLPVCEDNCVFLVHVFDSADPIWPLTKTNMDKQHAETYHDYDEYFGTATYFPPIITHNVPGSSRVIPPHERPGGSTRVWYLGEEDETTN